MFIKCEPDSPEWHALRAKNIGSSEIAALFNLSPFMTHFELWHLKKQAIESSFTDTKRTRYGRKMEAVIAEAVAEETGWLIDDIGGYYISDTVAGLGSTPDRRIVAPDRAGHGALEIKNIDWLQFKKEWGEGEPPIYYLLQLQHQLACTGWQWGCIAPMVGGNDVKRFIVERHNPTIAKIEQATAEFWRSIEANEPPPPFAADDYEIVKQIYRTADGGDIDLSGDNELPSLCSELLNTAAIRKAAEKREAEIKGQILYKVGNHTLARCNDFTIRAPEIIKNMPAKEAYVQKYRTLNIKEKI